MMPCIPSRAVLLTAGMAAPLIAGAAVIAVVGLAAIVTGGIALLALLTGAAVGVGVYVATGSAGWLADAITRIVLPTETGIVPSTLTTDAHLLLGHDAQDETACFTVIDAEYEVIA